MKAGSLSPDALWDEGGGGGVGTGNYLFVAAAPKSPILTLKT